MITGMVHAFYQVADLDRSIHFYRDVLGLRIKRQEDKWVEFDLGGVTLGLLVGRSSAWPGGRNGAEVALKVDNINQVMRELRSRGVSSLGILQGRPQGWTVPVDDPDGNRLYLVEPAQVYAQPAVM